MFGAMDYTSGGGERQPLIAPIKSTRPTPDGNPVRGFRIGSSALALVLVATACIAAGLVAVAGKLLITST